MKKYSKIIVVGIILIVLGTVFIFKNKGLLFQKRVVIMQTQTAQPEPKTEILDYVQTDIPTNNESGNCWTNSIASSSQKAFRCMVGNFIYDPCFEINEKQVVCNVLPESNNKDGFVINLTKPLPTTTNEGNLVAWMMGLSNGLMCTKMTGTADYVDNQISYYYCNDNNAVILGYNPIDTTNPLWKVKVGYHNTTQINEVSITKIWR